MTCFAELGAAEGNGCPDPLHGVILPWFKVRPPRVIKQYIKDKKQAPHSLQDLVEAGYFRQVPIDPMTNSNSSWKPVIERSSFHQRKLIEVSRIYRAGRTRSHPMEPPILPGSY
jgi:hypothetical protein